MRYNNLLRQTLNALILFSNQISRSSLNHNGFNKNTQSTVKIGKNITVRMLQCMIRIRHQFPPSGVIVTVCFFMTYYTDASLYSSTTSNRFARCQSQTSLQRLHTGPTRAVDPSANCSSVCQPPTTLLHWIFIVFSFYNCPKNTLSAVLNTRKGKASSNSITKSEPFSLSI